MKKNNLWRITWIVGIYAILISILYLIVVYKVQWEDKDLNTYLYFYNCNNKLCTSTIAQDEYYGKVLCEDNICPYVKEINDNNSVLTNGDTSWIYDYKNDKVVNDTFLNYRYLDNNHYVVTDNSGKQGIIDIDGNILVDFNYKHIADYKDGYVVYKDNGNYGIVNEDKYISIDAKYDDIILINDKMYAFKDENGYHISYYNGEYVTNNVYNYLYSYKNVIIVFYDKKIDILGTDLNSLLLMKIDTFYEYKKVGEVNTLNIYNDSNSIYFSLYNGNDEYKKYEFDYIDNKLR